MGDDTEWLKLPADDKCVHKVWKARVAGYEEATKLFNSQTDEKSPEFSKYLGLVKKFVTDNNAIAQEKALDAVLAFVENAALAGRTCGEVVSGIVAKCLNSSRTKTREKALEIIMLYVEIDKPDPVQEELMKGLENKQPKIVVGCIQALREALGGFGTKVIKVKPIVKVLPKLLEDRDKNVREETKLLIIEIFRWIGPAIKPQMTHYKPVQVQELEAEFEKLGNERAVQTRFMRSQQDLRAQMEEKAAASGGTGAGDSVVNAAPVEDVDPYDLMDPVDILSALPKDFYEKIEAKKWQERREALDALHKLSETPKLQNGDYGTLVRALLKVIGKDTNVMLVTLAAKCLAGIANGLRKRFSQYATNSIQTILEKFKEKKATVVAALRECIDACYTATSLDPISEDILAALENKNPSIKAETSLFLARCFAKATTATLPKKLLKAFCGELCKKINDTAPDVREAAFTALGTAMKVVGEKPLTPFLADIDSIKLGKIKEQCEAAVLLNARGEPRGGAVANAKPAAAKAPEPKPVARPPSRSSSAKPAAGKSSKPAGSGPAKKKPAGKKDAKKGGSDEVQENILPDEVVEEKVAALLPADTVSQLASSNWKERLASMEKFTQVVKGMSRDEIPAQVFVRTVCNKPGLKDTNFQVLKLRLELIAFLAKNSSFSKRSASFCLTELVDKVGDVKNGSASQEALSCIAEATGLEFVAAEVIHLAFEQKNPKNQAESLNWLANALKEFGFKIQVKPMIENIKKAFAATNPAVRTAALNLLSTLFLYMGATLRVFFDGEKAALLQQIDAEFEKLKGEKPPAPVRGLAPRGGKGDEEEEPEEEEEDAPALADLIPRTDISEKITDALLTEMGDKSWKIRAEGLQKVVSILNEAKFISANIGQLPEALKTRLGDSNKILVMTTLTICQTMGTALGPHCKGHVRIIGPGITTCMGDSKPHVRAAAVSAMNIWAENATLLPFVEAEVFSDALKLENPALRAELLGWLSEKLPPHKQLPTELKMCIPHVLSCLEDRNGDVRKKAQEALVPFMIHTGYDSFQKATSKLKPASKDQIMGIIEKARANVPAKPSKKSAAKAAPAPAAAAPPPKVEARDEDDEEVEAINAPSRPASTSGGKGKAKQGSAKSKATPTATKKKKDEEDMGPAIIINVPKEQRMKDEKALKILKWNFTEPRLEFVDQLKLQMEKNFNKPLMAQLFHADFKQHIKAIESLMKVLETDMEATAANLDVLLRWMTLRFFDTNPSMLNKALEYLRILFTALAEMDYHLTESEASSFIPYLVNKVGDPKDNVRRDVRTIFKLLCKVYPSSKMSGFMLDGLKAKNAKLRTECLEELGCLIDLYGVNVCQPSPAQALKLIAQQIGDRDNCVRSAALNTLVSAYLILGEQTYKYVGKLKDKDQSLLEERIKRSAKNKPAAAPSQPVQGQAKNNKERPKSGPPPSDRIDSVMAGIPKSASSQSVRKGAFSLEMEEEEGDFKVSDVKLIDLDFDDILKETIELPKTNRSHRSPPSNAALGSSNDAASAIGLVIAQIASTDTNAAIQALAQIDEVLKDKEKSELMLTHVDQLLLTLSMQLKMVYSKHMGDDINIGEENVMKLYRCLLGTVIEVFQNKTLARQASKDILKDLLGNLVTNLLDKRLEDFEEGTQVIRTVNVTIVKIVGKSDPTTIIGAVIKLLQECVGSETCSKKYIEIIMKCLWKTIRMLPDIISEINVDRLLLDAHLFLKAFPSSYWRERSSDIPYRTIKTVIHTLYKMVGNSILSHTGLIEQPNSEVISYLNKLLNNSKNEIMNGDNKMPQKEGKPSKRLSKSTHEDLVEIFKKIGSKENSKEGLNYLYDFKKKHPEADLEPFMRKSSQYFQQYVERGLKTIEQEREGKLTHSNAGNVLGNSNAPSVIGSSEASEGDSAAYYREKLRILRARCGMDNNAAEQENNEPVRRPNTEISENALPPVTSSERVQSEPQVREEEGESSGTSATDLLELRKRLERIKKMAS